MPQKPDYGVGPYKIIGKSVPVIIAYDRVSGKAKYCTDIYLTDMLYAVSIVSPFPKFKIVSVDSSAAEAIPGVRLVMTPFNFPNAFLDGGKVGYYAGEEVACVVADTEEIAEAAIDGVKIQYETDKNFVVDLESARKPEAPIVFEGAKSNVTTTQQPFWSIKNAAGLWTKRVTADYGGYGDIAVGFKESDVIVEADGLHYSMEKNPCPGDRGIVADYRGRDSVNETLHIYIKSKGLYDDRTRIGSILELPSSKVTAIAPYSGGAWGMAGSMNTGTGETKGPEMACFASQALNRPVRFMYTHNREMMQSWSKYSWARIKLGFKTDGTLWAMDHEEYVESGSYPSSSVGSANRLGGMLAYNRNCQHMRIYTARVASNRLKQRDFVGIGTAPGNYHVEWAMDLAAEKLGLDPIEVRKKNHMLKGSFEGTGGAPLQWLSQDGHSESLDAVAARANWKANWKPPSAKAGVVRHGMGVAIKTHTGGSWAGSSMIVKMHADGSVEMLSSIGDTGQGEPTAQCMMAAEVLGVPYGLVSMSRGTTHEPYAIMLGGSTGSWNTGFSTWEAAQNCRDQILTFGSALLGNAPIDDLDMDYQGVWKKSDPAGKKTLVQVFARMPVAASREIIGYSYRRAPDGNAVPKEKGASIAELDVDTETGMISNVLMHTANTVGRAMNPRLQENQGNMGAVKGAHCALLTDNVTDYPTGKNMTYNWLYYPAPTCLDIEATIDVVNKPGDVSHPFGASAGSEGQPNPHAAAVANAIYNAIGVRVKRCPFTPDKILQALGKI